MKKITVLMAVILGLVLLLGSATSNLRQDVPVCQQKPEPKRQPYCEYTVVHGHGQGELVDAVKEKLNESWRPIGGISVDDGNCYQAMIRK